jgi:hypothetical protein
MARARKATLYIEVEHRGVMRPMRFEKEVPSGVRVGSDYLRYRQPDGTRKWENVGTELKKDAIPGAQHSLVAQLIGPDTRCERAAAHQRSACLVVLPGDSRPTDFLSNNATTILQFQQEDLDSREPRVRDCQRRTSECAFCRLEARQEAGPGDVDGPEGTQRSTSSDDLAVPISL